MALFHRATITPTKAELIADWAPSQPWGPAADSALEVVGAFRFDDPDGRVGMETHLVTDGGTLYHVPLTYRDEPVDGGDGFIAEMEHSALGTRWVYDGLRDDRFVVMLAAVAMTGQGEAIGMVEYEGRWHIAPANVRIQGGGWSLDRVPVDGFEATDADGPTVVLRNDRFELTAHRRPVAAPRPAIGLNRDLGRASRPGRARRGHGALAGISRPPGAGRSARDRSGIGRSPGRRRQPGAARCRSVSPGSGSGRPVAGAPSSTSHETSEPSSPPGVVVVVVDAGAVVVGASLVVVPEAAAVVTGGAVVVVEGRVVVDAGGGAGAVVARAVVLVAEAATVTDGPAVAAGAPGRAVSEFGPVGPGRRCGGVRLIGRGVGIPTGIPVGLGAGRVVVASGPTLLIGRRRGVRCAPSPVGGGEGRSVVLARVAGSVGRTARWRHRVAGLAGGVGSSETRRRTIVAGLGMGTRPEGVLERGTTTVGDEHGDRSQHGGGAEHASDGGDRS